NFVRLAHYPHNEMMVRTAEQMGLLVWEEIPVYWTIDWKNRETYKNAESQLADMIMRDKNRAATILWSIGNETPVRDDRLDFMKNLALRAKEEDPTRLVTAALEQHEESPDLRVVNDPLGKYLDVIGLNEYIGWYTGLPEKCLSTKWRIEYRKPLIISEFGADALAGYHADKLTRWSEEYQQDMYEKQFVMLKKIETLRGVAPWILKDFRSPRRPLPKIQDGWNRKGLVSEKGERKKAFYSLQGFYRDWGRL
ncbi:MAG: beta-glucuronidase, partial [Oligoflexales bacterium]|nr:beta-glucuronidase [Oligoflexales bacterium]